MRKESGFTLVEITIILLVLVILSAILLPTIERFIDLARVVRAKEDVGMLAAVVSLFLHDTNLPCFLKDGGYDAGGGTISSPSILRSSLLRDNNRIDVLFSDGNAPSLDIVGPPLGLDFWGWYGLGIVDDDTITNQLVLGNPYGADPLYGYQIYPNDWYPRPHSPNGPGFRGAYISTPVSADPWGNRYAINVAFLHSDGSPTADLFGLGATVADFLSKDVFVLSAGPDGKINTSFYVDGVIAQRDDIIAVIKGQGVGHDQLP